VCLWQTAANVSWKPLFSRFLSAAPHRLHFAAHSHHYWPDVALEAQSRAWLDAATYADQKWDVIYADVLPRAQRHIARILDLPDPATLAFGPNTHEFLLRLLSCLPLGRRHRILTTDGEFHSCARQLLRLEEEGLIEVVRVPTRPFSTFLDRFAAAASSGHFDLAYVSQVFFDSGYAIHDLPRLVASIEDPATLIAIDGYHAFCALPTSLSSIADRVFYLAGGYKYAMSGEGVCFMHCPPSFAERPRDTGWFAAFGALEQAQRERVGYGPGGARMMGATFDPTGLYRLVAVMDLLVREELSIDVIHAHVRRLQQSFVDRLAAIPVQPLRRDALLVDPKTAEGGHFLTWALPTAKAIHAKLLSADVVTDVRGDRLRFGFGLYHDQDDLDRAMPILQRVLAE
jgi:kynureninase